MSTYHVEVSGKFNLEQISEAISGEEILLAKFLSSKLWVNAQHELTNLVEFEVLSENPNIGEPQFVLQLPADKTLRWTGPMIIEGKALTTYMYR